MDELEELQAAADTAETAYTAAHAVCIAVSSAEQATVLAVAKKVVADAVAREFSGEALDTQAITDSLSVIHNAYTVSKAITNAANRATDAAWDVHIAARDAAALY